ncbi:GNAT family N-acetyltransferase [Paenibacillus sp. JCM 10914]|uniref:GNAT family N-acetyltransferase n=1 Tax=Paenibacillus sp. JCM 10914 TaxID=1236974 RepID=UPI0003CCAB06|nr:GNAT family N-acetyltransferase [Paenibacillus sp. JCM 10914]GAE07384.1 acetyltransferase, GNAT family [Paenibacillus sp. JCM 10914]
MTIRAAKPDDAAEAAQLLYDALHDVAYKLTGETTKDKVLAGLELYFRADEGRLGHRQFTVKEIDNEVAGLIVTYGGDQAEELDRPIVDRLRGMDHAFTGLDQEADLDEYYIDTLSVSSTFGGQGIGSALIDHAEKQAVARVMIVSRWPS